MQFDSFLQPNFFIDYSNPAIRDFVNQNVNQGKEKIDIVIDTFRLVREHLRYNPYNIFFTKEKYKASDILTREEGHCIDKAILLCACFRALGFASRLSFSKVINHIGTARLEKNLKTNILAFHGNTEVYLNGRWIKLTPAFNQDLCSKFGVPVLDFDGENDCMFHAYKSDGNLFMEYVHDYGAFSDFPLPLFISEMKRNYPHLFEDGKIPKANWFSIA